jgi:DHA1 family bicyclomycin/chloramphenicol resistance-like MFS transporter
MNFTMQPARTAPHIATLISLASISALTMNIFLPSLPTMTAHFGADYAVMQLSVALYLAVSAALQIVIGPLSDRYGRRPVLLWGLSLFCLATIGTLVAPTTEWFLAARMAQAVMAVGLVLSRAVVRDMVPTDQAASMIGYVTMGMSIVPMIGPGIGGVLDQAFGWQANFWLLLGLGVAMLYSVYVDLGETLPADRLGAGQSFRAQIRDYPHLLLSQRFWGYCLASAFASGAFFAYLGGAPFVGTTLFDLDPAMLGFLFGAPALGYFAGNWITGKYAARVSLNMMVLVGAILITLGMTLLFLTFLAGIQTELVFFGFMTTVGLGNGMVIPNATAGMLSVRPQLAGTASGLGSAIMIGGGAALSAMAGIMLNEETGAWPLLWIMMLTSFAALACILYTIHRERQLARQA